MANSGRSVREEFRKAAVEETFRPRIDKWLWAARFFKTRSLAAQAVEGGRVHVNGARVKPAKEIRPGDEVRIATGDCESVLVVKRLSDRRGPATVARELYEETEASRARREAALAARKDYVEPAAEIRGRPTKREGRRLRRLSES
jgi:ribosome-associated heat shock protein Hsp15